MACHGEGFNEYCTREKQNGEKLGLLESDFHTVRGNPPFNSRIDNWPLDLPLIFEQIISISFPERPLQA